MSLNTYGQYTPTNQITPYERGRTTPEVELCESVVPGVGYGIQPAPWLPIKRYDDWIKSGVVISVGTAVGFDNSGYLIPAGMVGGTTTISYTQYDVTMKVIDIRTGLPVTAAADNVTVPSAMLGNSTGVAPVGFATYNIYQNLGAVTATGTWASDYGYVVDIDNPMGFRMHNTTKETNVAFTCDYVIEVPWVGATEPSGLSSEALSYAHAYGSFKYGGFVKVDSKGMYIPSTTQYGDLLMGQVIGIKAYANTSGVAIDALDRVKTADSYTPVAWQMPGTATKGMPRAIHLATDGAYAVAKTAGSSLDSSMFTTIIINIQK